MLVGIFIRYFKTYQGINFIPLTDEDKFCGLLGDNGIGKSSVLEAMDCFFNAKPWNLNVSTKKSGTTNIKPYIVPVFLIKRSEFRGDVAEKSKTLSDVITSLTEDDIAISNRAHFKKFKDLLNRLKRNIELDSHYLLPVGIDHLGNTNLSIFNCQKLSEKVSTLVSEEDSSKDNFLESFFKPVLDKIKSAIEYIYIPREIDPELFTKLETNEIQVLMGESLNEILERRVTPSQISEINSSLNSFINELSSELDSYAYRTPTDRQQNLRKNDVYNLIIEAFFKIRKLHKLESGHWLEIGNLSSGEKQKAIIDVAHKLLIHHRNNANNLIIGIDEPESSLHMSACFDQFDALYDISRSCRQVLFSSHWYGFLPTIETGSISVISRKDNEHVFDLINLENYREQIKQLIRESRKALPYDIRLKSINDFVQSIITSSIGDNCYNWLICEGMSEKIYFSKYLSDLVEDKKLRIVPVGGAGEIKRLYNHLSTSYEDFKDEISGKIILISDTDKELVKFETKEYPNLICKRIVNCDSSKKTKMVNVSSNPISPETEIEDALNGSLFIETLRSFINEDDSELSFLNEIKISDTSLNSHFLLDLRPSEKKILENFFDKENNKFNFAKAYTNNICDDHVAPDWILEIRGWIT